MGVKTDANILLRSIASTGCVYVRLFADDLDDQSDLLTNPFDISSGEVSGTAVHSLDTTSMTPQNRLVGTYWPSGRITTDKRRRAMHHGIKSKFHGRRKIIAFKKLIRRKGLKKFRRNAKKATRKANYYLAGNMKTINCVINKIKRK